MHEAQMHDSNEYVTLTYRDENLIYGGASHGILVPRHLTLFFKRLRKRYGRGLKYFACGEYGDKSGRPHYHAIIFGLNLKDKVIDSTKNGYRLYRSDSIDNLWGHGNCIVGDVTFESCAYVARYVMKKRLGKEAEQYEQEGITPEFVRMSRGGRHGPGGIGLEWLEKYKSDVYPRGNVLVNGHLAKPPKYYDSYYEKLNPVKMDEIRAKRLEEAQKRWKENEPERLQVRERVKIAATKSLTRKLE